MSQEVDMSEQEQIAEVASMVEQLFMFTAFLIPYIDLLEKVSDKSAVIESRVGAMAPMLTAVGEDWEEKDMEAKLRRRRAEALLNLVKILKETEQYRAEFNQSKTQKAKARAELNAVLGL